MLLLSVIVILSHVSCGTPTETPSLDLSALEAELALAINEQGDYTSESYNAYKTVLGQAKEIANDTNKTQEAVDEIATALTEARLALLTRDVSETVGGEKSFYIISGASREINISDYVNTNGLGKITYKVKTSNAVLSVGTVENARFTLTAGGVREATDVTVTISVLYDNVEKLKVTLSVCITNDQTPSIKENEVLKEYDLITLENKESVVLDFSENVNNPGGIDLIYSAVCEEESLTLNGSLYTLLFGYCTENTVYKTITVTISYIANGESGSLTYTYKIGTRDTGVYGMANGGFENGLDGWTIITTQGDKPFGGIDNKTTFWGEGYPMNNIGNYFSSYADGAEEASMGTLASPYFVVKSQYASYMLGGGGNRMVYITLENKDGEVLAIYRNTKFADFPEGEYSLEEKTAMIGSTVFLANMVTYKVNLAEFEGEEVRFVIHDYASSGWGVVFFDELVTYYSSPEEMPEGAVLAENLLANKNALILELGKAIEQQGDYTTDSYNTYAGKLAQAIEVARDDIATQEEVDRVTEALTEARLALTIRAIEEVAGANKNYKLTSGYSKEFTLSDYINTNNLSAITYQVVANDEFVTVGDITDGKFTITAGEVEEKSTTTVTIIVYYNNTKKLEVILSIDVSDDLSPVILNSEVALELDIYNLSNKDGIALDLSENIYNVGGYELTYSVSYGGATTVVEGASYTFQFGKYTETVTTEVLTVTISFVVNEESKSISYTYKLAIKDTTSYRLVNGGFENGLDGWTLVGNIGGVSSDTNYWVEEWENGGRGYEFGLEGEYMFSAYKKGALESAVGTLTSSKFVIGGSGFVSFKLGAAKDGNYVYIDIVDAKTKEIIARYYNGLWAETTDGLKSGCTLVAYKADLSQFIGREVFIRVSDNADSGYGLFFLDSFVTYYTSEPEGFNEATAVNYTVSGTIYDVFNGGFEIGGVQGWWNNGEIGLVTDASGYWGDNIPYGKDGNFLFTGVESFGADTMREGNRGVLTSSVFEIGGTGYISFKLGGGGNVLCYVQVIDAVTGEVLARYRQQAQQDAKLIQYVADLSAYIGRSVRFQVVDQAASGWGCVSFDSLVTYYRGTEALPEGLVATDILDSLNYDIVNGSFENGLEGWNMNITEGGAHNTLGWVTDTEIDTGWYEKNTDTKDGDNLFTFVLPDDTNCENSKGTLTSSSFSLKKGAYVSFLFGGAGGGINHDVYIELCRADGSVIARFYNDKEGKINTRMNAYFYQYTGEEVECFFRVVDNSVGDYGCFVVDNFQVNLAEIPEGYTEAIR